MAIRVDEDMGLGQLARALAEALGPWVEAVDLAYPPAHDSVRIVPSGDGSRVSVHYVAKDEYPPADFWQAGLGNGEMVDVGEARARGVAERCAKLGVPVLGVDMRSKEPTVLAPAARAATHIYVPSPAVVDEARSGVLGESGLAERCRRTLAAYAAWKEGDLCGVVTETFRVGADGALVLLDQRANWPSVDLEAATRLRDAVVRSTVEREASREAAPSGP